MLTVSLKVFLMLFLAGLIGWDREKVGRPAGFRTHILVGIGSTILMIVSIMVFEHYPESNSDPARIAAQVVSGIGFLGAGTILIEGSIVKGLTTAASLWATAAIGLAIGGGFYFVGIIGTFVVFISLFLFSSIGNGKSKKVTEKLICKIDDSEKDLYKLIYNKMYEKDCEISKIRSSRDRIHNEIIIDCRLEIENEDMKEINNWLLDLDEVKEISWVEV